MICDDCVHNAVCEKAHFDNHCGYKHTEADVIKPELEKIKDKMMDDGAYFQEVEGHTDFVKGISHCIDIVEKELLRLEGENK